MKTSCLILVMISLLTWITFPLWAGTPKPGLTQQDPVLKITSDEIQIYEITLVKYCLVAETDQGYVLTLMRTVTEPANPWATLRTGQTAYEVIHVRAPLQDRIKELQRLDPQIKIWYSEDLYTHK